MNHFKPLVPVLLIIVGLYLAIHSKHRTPNYKFMLFKERSLANKLKKKVRYLESNLNSCKDDLSQCEGRTIKQTITISYE